MLIRKFISLAALAAAITLSLASPASLAEIEIATSGDGQRAMAKRVSATIIDIDYETRDVVLEGALGNTITLQAGPEVERFNEFQVGDLIVSTYIQSLSGDLRDPTEEELKVPWMELDAAAIADETSLPGAGVGQVIRAVCTIEGMNRATGTVTLLDPRGYYHVIGDVAPEKMEGVTLGQTIIITYTRAVALTLEKHEEG